MKTKTSATRRSKDALPRHPMAIALDRWFESDDGRQCARPQICKEPGLVQFLINRLNRAFRAGWLASEMSPNAVASHGRTPFAPRPGSASRKPVGHELKTLPEYLDAVGSGAKTFEVRRDDRDFQVGDWLTLREWDDEIAQFGPRCIACKISYVLRGPASEPFGLRHGFCVLGIKLPTNHHWPPNATASATLFQEG